MTAQAKQDLREVRWVSEGDERLPFVVPAGAELTPEQAARLEMAQIGLGLGMPESAADLIGRVQRELGVTPEEHVVALEAEAGTTADRIRRAREKRETEQRRRVRSMQPPAPPYSLSMDQRGQALDDAEAKYQEARAAVERWRKIPKDETEGQRFQRRKLLAAARARLRPLESKLMQAAKDFDRAMRQRDDAAFAAQALVETTALAEHRGEEVERVKTMVADWRRDDRGAMVRVKGSPILDTDDAETVRVNDRAGLAVAYERGALDGGTVSGERLYEVAKKYRRCVEKAEGRRTPNRDGPKVDCDVQIDPGRDYRAEAARDLSTMRLGLTPMERQVLDLVCGLDHSVGGTARVLGLHSRKVEEALRTGLHKAGEELLWW